ncbi:MAG: hypothetical protein B7C54_11325 [Acidimicrobiales bacterium mtb01]|nr:hypothetical protein [Actinomycetota bacterium]TEX45640.1 MAG: hypothetical protein B7C54_11325 [Acidimicrobiales bacterium mtb01]
MLGSSWRATVTPWGDVVGADDASTVRWYVAADDRWYHPEREVAVRQRMIDGAPVFETRVRVPGGDVVQRVWSASGERGRDFTLLEFENDSPMPVVVALSNPRLISMRALVAQPARGLDEDAPVVVPIGHRSSVRLALPHDPRFEGGWPDDVADFAAVARGWVSTTERAGRIDVPELSGGLSLVDAVVAARCQIALLGDDPSLDAATRLVAAGERAAMGLETFDDVAATECAESVIGDVRRTRVDVTLARLALSAAWRMLSDQERAQSDLVAAVARARRVRASALPEMWAPIQSVVLPDWSSLSLPAHVSDRLVRWTGDGEATLLADGLPDSWLGSSCEAHGVPVTDHHRVSWAIRWHGERPAVLWEVDGPPGLRLRSGVDSSWSTTEPRGEALWIAPRRPPTSLAVGSESFG